MGLFNPWCFCPHALSDPSKSAEVRQSVYSNNGAIVSLKLKENSKTGTGILIHRMVVLTTHGTLPSIAAAKGTELLIRNSENNRKKLDPERFFVTSEALDITAVACDGINTETLQTLCLDNTNDPFLSSGRRVYLLGRHQNQLEKDVMMGDGRITVETEPFIKFCADGEIWSPGSAGFDIWGNLAFMICDPMKLVGGMDSRRRKFFSWKKDRPKQFGITVPMIKKWLKENWNDSIEDLDKTRVPKRVKKASKKQESLEISRNSGRPIGIYKQKEEQESELLAKLEKGRQQPFAHRINQRKNEQDFRNLPSYHMKTLEDFMGRSASISAQLNKKQDTVPAHCSSPQEKFKEKAPETQMRQTGIGRNRQCTDGSRTSDWQSEPQFEIPDTSNSTVQQLESQEEAEEEEQCLQTVDRSNIMQEYYKRPEEKLMKKSNSIPAHHRSPTEDFMNISNIITVQCKKSHEEFMNSSQSISVQSSMSQDLMITAIDAKKKSIGKNVDRLNISAWQREPKSKLKESELQEEEEEKNRKEKEEGEEQYSFQNLNVSNTNSTCYRGSQEEFMDLSNPFPTYPRSTQEECMSKSSSISVLSNNSQDIKVPAVFAEQRDVRKKEQSVDRSSTIARQGEPQFKLLDSLSDADNQVVSQEEEQEENHEQSFFHTSISFAAELRRLQEEQFQEQSSIVCQIMRGSERKMQQSNMVPHLIKDAQSERDGSSISCLQITEPQREGLNLEKLDKYKEDQTDKEYNEDESQISEPFVGPQTAWSRDEQKPSICEGPPKKNVQEVCNSRHPAQNSEEQEPDTAEDFAAQLRKLRKQYRANQTKIDSLNIQSHDELNVHKCSALAQIKDHDVEELCEPSISTPQNEGQKEKDLARSMIFPQFKEPKGELELDLAMSSSPAEVKHLEEKNHGKKQFSSKQHVLEKHIDVLEKVEDEVEEVLEAKDFNPSTEKAEDKLDDAKSIPESLVAKVEANVRNQEVITEQRLKESKATDTRADITAENMAQRAEDHFLDYCCIKKEKDLAEKSRTSIFEQSKNPQIKALESHDLLVHNDKAPRTEMLFHDEPKKPSTESSYARGLPMIPQNGWANCISEECISITSVSDTESLNKENQTNQMSTLSQASSSRDPETSDAETTFSIETRFSINSSPTERYPKKNQQERRSQSSMSSRGTRNSVQPKARSALKIHNSQVHPACVRSLRGQVSNSGVRNSAEYLIPTVSSLMKKQNLYESNLKKSTALLSPRWVL
eukprot:Gb_18622 [translate_table: standard]